MQDSTQMFYLRRLISTRPAEEHDETCLRYHRNINPKSIDAYARIMAAVISCIHRVITNLSLQYIFPVSPDVASARTKLMSSLRASNLDDEDEDIGVDVHEDITLHYNSDDDSDIDEEEDYDLTSNAARTAPKSLDSKSKSIRKHLTCLLYLLFTQTPNGCIRDDFFNPLAHYTLLSSSRKGGQWAPSGAIIHNIAALLFTGRLIFAWKIHGIMDDEKCSVPA